MTNAFFPTDGRSVVTVRFTDNHGRQLQSKVVIYLFDQIGLTYARLSDAGDVGAVEFSPWNVIGWISSMRTSEQHDASASADLDEFLSRTTQASGPVSNAGY